MNARLTVAMAGLLIVLSSSLGAKWLLVEPMTAALDPPSAAPSTQLAASAPPQSPAPIEAAPAAPPSTLPRVAEAVPSRPDTAPVPPAREKRPALEKAASATLNPLADTSGHATASHSLGLFEGPVDNQTMNRSGRLAIAIVKDPETGAIRASFHAGEGLLGTGELAGKITEDGRISASGTLMMGKNPFLCDLSGQLNGTQLVGSAQFVRPWGGRIAHSVFRLVKS